MLAIIDYGVGNLNSIQNMLKKAAINAVITSNIDTIKASSKILLPGMGHFDNCMLCFNQSGFRDVIEEKVFIEKVPILGICVGLQMFMKGSEEGVQDGLGWLNGRVVRFKKDILNQSLKIPNMGWHSIVPSKESRLLCDLIDSRFYFAHSFHVEVSDNSLELAKANYGYDFTCAVEYNNIFGVQFHPEKSHRFGLQLLKNFANI